MLAVARSTSLSIWIVPALTANLRMSEIGPPATLRSLNRYAKREGCFRTEFYSWIFAASWLSNCVVQTNQPSTEFQGRFVNSPAAKSERSVPATTCR
jgi:hypothetical protein